MQSSLSRFGNGTRALRQAKAAHPRPIRGILPQRNPRESVESPSHRKASRKGMERERRTKATKHALMAVWGTHLHVEPLPASVESPRQRPGRPAGQSPAGASEAPARRVGPYGAPGQRGSARDQASVSSCQSWLRLHQLPHAARFGRVLRPMRDRPEIRRYPGDRRGTRPSDTVRLSGSRDREASDTPQRYANGKEIASAGQRAKAPLSTRHAPIAQPRTEVQAGTPRRIEREGRSIARKTTRGGRMETGCGFEPLRCKATLQVSYTRYPIA